jgi:hypothetical protein
MAERHNHAGFEEFHACDLLAGNKPFEDVGRPEALGYFSAAIDAFVGGAIPVIYGAVDLGKLFAN